MRALLAGLLLLHLGAGSAHGTRAHNTAHNHALLDQIGSSHGRQLHASHRFKKGDHVELFANKAGPFANPAETYQYYDLPFCRLGGDDSELKHKREGLGEVVDGNRQIHTPYDLSFRVDREHTVLCTKELTQKEVQKFRKAVMRNYYYNMFYDDLPIWGFVGKVENVKKPGGLLDTQYYLFTHVHFDIMYNEDRIIEINVRADPKQTVDISPLVASRVEGQQVPAEFTYSVKWKETNIPYAERMNKYRKEQFLPKNLEIHWFSIINSCVTVLLLTGFLATILMRVLKNDFMRFRSNEEGEDQDETGWKYIHGDVFRFPKHRNLFCALIGTGFQLLMLSISVCALACAGQFAPHNKGGLMTAIIVLYAATAGIAGYVAASYYKQMDGSNWVRNLLTTCVMFCGPLFLVFCFNNTVAWIYRSTAALPIGTIIVILLIWGAVTIPLTVFGGIAGKNHHGAFAAPVRTNKYPREIPDLPWYRSTGPQMIMAGFLPFSAIYIELYYIFASVWGHKVYAIYSILSLVFLILLLVTGFICVALTYFQLAVEDHEWWWRSFLCGGSTGIFVFVYCFYYYFFRSDMSGLMQTSFYFGYMLCVCFGFFIMLGTVGWRASLLFVRHIYKAVKCE